MPEPTEFNRHSQSFSPLFLTSHPLGRFRPLSPICITQHHIAECSAKVFTHEPYDPACIRLVGWNWIPSPWLTCWEKSRRRGKHVEVKMVNPLTHKPYPPDKLKVIVETAKAVLSGNIDTGAIVRKVMVDVGEWELPEGVHEMDPELLEIQEGDEELE
jgi:hypothetical protein